MLGLFTSAHNFDPDDFDLDEKDSGTDDPDEFKKRSEGGIMLTFVKNAFSKFLGVLLWLNLIVCAIVGCVTGYQIGDESAGLGLLGLIIGALVGLGTNIYVGGLIATIISIEKNTAGLRKTEE